MSPRPLRVFSWNVNGLRACARKGFADWLRRARRDVLGLQEVRARPDDPPAAMRFVLDAFHQSEATGSDHCPVGVVMDPAACA